MTCRVVQSRLSAFLDGELRGAEARAVAAHLEACAGCAVQWRSLQASMRLVASLPALPPPPISQRVLDRLEVESRGPGLALLFRPFWAARPLIWPSLVPAALVVMTVVAGALAFDRDPRPAATARASAPTREARDDDWSRPFPPSGTEENPLFPSKVAVPQIRTRALFPEEELGERSSMFLETVVARDGSVSDVRLLEGDSVRAQPYVEALRLERFEPPRFEGRPVAVSLYRLISRVEVRSPI